MEVDDPHDQIQRVEASDSYVQPTHQGRAADYIMTQMYAEKGKFAIGNMHFDTFRGNAEMLGALPLDYAIDEGLHANDGYDPFKGNIDLEKLSWLPLYHLRRYHHRRIQ